MLWPLVLPRLPGRVGVPELDLPRLPRASGLQAQVHRSGELHREVRLTVLLRVSKNCQNGTGRGKIIFVTTSTRFSLFIN
jgi:hypothetical protein